MPVIRGERRADLAVAHHRHIDEKNNTPAPRKFHTPTETRNHTASDEDGSGPEFFAPPI
jgi:hypothetical protein